MENVKITFLGTGDAKPTKKRNHTAILLSYKNENILIDCGEGTQRQLKIAGISAHKINKILITHKHGDHTFGLPGLFYSLALDGYSKTLSLYGPKGINEYIALIKQLGAEFPINLNVNEASGKFLETPDYYIEALPMSHKVPTNAYSFVIKEKIRLDKAKLKKLKLPNSPILKQLAQRKDIIFNKKKIKASQVTYKEPGKKITFVLDTAINENAIKLAKDSDVLITESSFAKEDEARARDYKHLTSQQAAEIAKKSKSKQLILTHISQRYESDLSKIEKEAKKVFKKVKMVKDFDSVTI